MSHGIHLVVDDTKKAVCGEPFEHFDKAHFTIVIPRTTCKECIRIWLEKNPLNPHLQPKRARLSCDVTQAFKDQLESLQEKTQAGSLTEVIRRAVAAYQGIVDYHAIGGKVIFRAPNGTESTMLPL